MFFFFPDNCFFLRLWGETAESAKTDFARSFRPALCPVSWLGEVRALGRLRSCSFPVSLVFCGNICSLRQKKKKILCRALAAKVPGVLAGALLQSLALERRGWGCGVGTAVRNHTPF